MGRDVIREKMPQIIEYFVKFYGEEYRERITSRFNNTFFCYDSFAAKECFYEMWQFQEKIKSCVEEIIAEKFSTHITIDQEKYVDSIALEFFKILQQTNFKDVGKGVEIYHNLCKIFGVDSSQADDMEISKWYLDVAMSSKSKRLAALMDVITNYEDEVFGKAVEFYQKAYPNMEFDSLICGRETYLAFITGSICHPEVSGGCFNTTCYDDTSKVISMCFLPSLENLKENIILHELNHVFSSDVFFDGDVMISKTGLMSSELLIDFKNRSVYDIGDREEKTGLEEVINDFYTQGILELMYKDNFHLLDEERGYSDTIYSAAFPSLRGFLIKYKDLIVRSRTDGKVREFKNLLGKENFKKLEQNVEDFIEFVATIRGDEIENEILSNKAQNIDNFSPLAKRYVNYLVSIKRLVMGLPQENSSESGKPENNVEEKEIY